MGADHDVNTKDFLRSRWLSPVALLLLWELASRVGLVPAQTLASPSSVVGTLVEMLQSGELPRNLAVSLRRALLGLGIGFAVGVALALCAGLARRGDALIDPLVQVKRTISVMVQVSRNYREGNFSRW